MASSAGILMFRRTGPRLEVLLVHPGGPFWHNRDEGAWSIPKGEMDEGEDTEVAARREFTEETGIAVSGPLEPLGEVRQRGGKRVFAFVVEGDLDIEGVKSNTFEMNGRQKLAGCSRFLKSIALHGSNCQQPQVKILRASGRFSIDLRSLWIVEQNRHHERSF